MDVYGIEALLGLPEFRVIDQVIRPKRLDVHLQRRETSLMCPRCQTSCSHVQESRPRCLRDLPIFERPVLLWLHLRRFAGQECHHRPGETSETFGPRVQWTTRLSQQVRAEFLGGCPGRELARRDGLSDRTVCRWTFERSRGGRPRQWSRALGIDEYARRKGHHDNTSMVDWDKGRPMATLKGRRTEEVIAWFKSRPHAARERVEVVVLEMSKTYASAIQQLFGESVQVIDRFQVVKLAVEALDEVWRSIQKPLEPEESTALKQRRRRWLQSANQLNVDEWIARDEWRRRFPQWREMIDGVQDMRLWFERKYKKPACEAFVKLIERARQSAQEPLQRMAGTLTRWCEPIVHSIGNRYSNGMTEGCNNKIKLIQRMAYGLRNEYNRRKRIMAYCGKT
jgi:transposase